MVSWLNRPRLPLVTPQSRPIFGSSNFHGFLTHCPTGGNGHLRFIERISWLLAPCSEPGTPLNGSMHGDDLRHDSWVTFSCDQNYQLDGDESIHCNDGSWSGSVPSCVGE